MSKAKFDAAKELIDEKRYDEARALLRTIDHPTAAKWLDKLDVIAPVTQATTGKVKKKPTRLQLVLLIVGGIIITIAILSLIAQGQAAHQGVQDILNGYK